MKYEVWCMKYKNTSYTIPHISYLIFHTSYFKFMSRYKHGIASVSLPGTLAQKMKVIAQAGYDGIEIFENDLTVSDIKPADLRKMATDLGIEIAALQPFRDYEAMPKEVHLKSLDRAERKFDLMEKLGTNRLFVCSNCSPLAINDRDLAAEQLHILAQRAAQRGFQIAYEALSWGRFVNLYHQSIDIVKRANHPNLGNLLDSYHIGVRGENMDTIYDIPKEKMTFVQVADSHYFDMSAIHIGRHLRCFPGQGTYPVVEFMKAVHATGYSGYISHEVFSDEFRAALLEPTALDGKRSLVWLEGEVTRDLLVVTRASKAKNTEGVSKTNSEQQVTNNESPITNNEYRVTGFEFIEFATDFINQQSLISLLTNLGFQETYRHKTKDVSLYQVGEITFVLNRQKQLVVEKSENTVCAVGYVVKNSENLEQWAKKLNYKWEGGSNKNDELNIPAVHGVGDILCYIVNEKDVKPNAPLPFYDVEFNPTGKVKNEKGLTKIDHIGHTVRADFFQANTLFYRAMLGLEIEDSLELFDPNGIVQSRVVKNHDKNIRISLSSTRSRNTSSDYFMNKLGGAGIQQIALATDDIFKTAESISMKEYILPMPSNYYDDLRAKDTLPLPLIQQMQDNNILFDTNTEGSFYHFYCKELNGLFIEIVQRIGNYDRYGEINAQLRLAAQARDRR
jgi:4-hydroxyphenylpyruvate dioxygenase